MIFDSDSGIALNNEASASFTALEPSEILLFDLS
jgi:hypothetical protein